MPGVAQIVWSTATVEASQAVVSPPCLFSPTGKLSCARSFLSLTMRGFTNICAVARPEWLLLRCYSISVVLLLMGIVVVAPPRKDMVRTYSV